ncbi:MAG TPA: UDP-N-acetylglucosamine--N-acetylmuramyl-(pentapeptide) pyrophosphoryl-undecaprenol N-acetylglucosamine transferase [bacterium]|nr:UDP-N-acetylglucosamine--N-acetylmuramyl-(pentapeptide) pyrophosphoryl-undecaprenol N-acetylglucosamine transferase [bacterium]HPN30665.1 UDP-N-acetylglucosamine--N-acetylmuramyl-(pentapeptide) pyrophosphoryl-undecaprenol N-acetylglucosamine transferase [bacterium]
MFNIVVTGGGTGGHFYPAYILYKKIESIQNPGSVSYIGSDYGIEKKLADELGLDYYLIQSRGFIGKNATGKISSLFLNFISILKSIKYLYEKKTDAVVAAGGYVSLPVLTAALILKKKIFIQEQNSFPGVTTRIFSRFADGIFSAFEDSAKFLKIKDKSKLTFISTPVRDDFFTGTFKEEKKTALAVGGSQGSAILNETIFQSLDFFNNSGVKLRWITGKNFYEKYKNCQNGNILVYEYRNDIHKLIGESELIISRAGATSIAEYSVLNKKVLFIPFRQAAHNHQSFNALSYSKNYCASVIEEKDLNKDIFIEKIKNLLSSEKKKGLKIDKNPADAIIESVMKTLTDSKK